jgi:hypothetical protein
VAVSNFPRGTDVVPHVLLLPCAVHCGDLVMNSDPQSKEFLGVSKNWLSEINHELEKHKVPNLCM